MTIKTDDNKSVQISEYGEHNNFAWVDQEQIFSKQKLHLFLMLINVFYIFNSVQLVYSFIFELYFFTV